jgi:hypothetical protein
MLFNRVHSFCPRRTSTSSVAEVIPAANGVDSIRRLLDREPAVRVSVSTSKGSVSFFDTCSDLGQLSPF